MEFDGDGVPRVREGGEGGARGRRYFCVVSVHLAEGTHLERLGREVGLVHHLPTTLQEQGTVLLLVHGVLSEILS